jgi:hypothetical protein
VVLKSVVSAQVAGSRYVPLAAVGTSDEDASLEFEDDPLPSELVLELFLLLRTTATGIMIARSRTITPATIPKIQISPK